MSTSKLPCTTAVCITPPSGSGAFFFSKLDCSTTKRMPIYIPNDTSSKSSRRHVSNAVLFGTDTTIPTAVGISTIAIGPEGCDTYHVRRTIHSTVPTSNHTFCARMIKRSCSGGRSTTAVEFAGLLRGSHEIVFSVVPYLIAGTLDDR